ncbi:MAG: hypothetical protein IJ770_04060 [Alphaproteobacteria bacterium]|nr:hypothetical protein [Alphaproteobacteria bacterium]
MVDKSMVDAINRLRGVSPSVPVSKTKSKESPEKSPIASQPSAAPTASAEDKAAFNNLIAKAPVDNTPEAEKKYTMEDLNNFLATIIPEE